LEIVADSNRNRKEPHRHDERGARKTGKEQYLIKLSRK
jgi:hypothetical protein